MQSTLSKNLEFFKNELPKLLNDVAYKDKFVIIHDAKICGVFDSFDGAITEAVSKFQPTDFIIQQVIDENERVNFLRSAL